MEKEPEFILEIREMLIEDGLSQDDVSMIIELSREFTAEILHGLKEVIADAPKHLRSRIYLATLGVLSKTIEAVLGIAAQSGRLPN
jgi:hypothetical protein